MAKKEHRFVGGEGGAALAVRITPRARANEIVEVMDNGVVRIRLTASEKGDLNRALIEFLADVLGAPVDRLDIVAGETGREKLVSILDVDAAVVQQRLLNRMSG